MSSFVSVTGWDGMQGGEGTLGECGAGRGWRDASGFLDGNGVGKGIARREVQETHRREVEALPWGAFSEPAFTVRLQETEDTGKQSKMAATCLCLP